MCPVRGAGSADNQHLRKGSWVRWGRREDVKLAENEKEVVVKETGTRKQKRGSVQDSMMASGICPFP